ncbi:MAG: Hsp20/alpha crystallin family protein [Candidatus Aenigmatarchaeota archaeon]
MRWSIWDDIRRMQREMDRMFENFLSHEFQSTHLQPVALTENRGDMFPYFREPLSDILEDEKEMLIKMEMPGVEKDDIIITAKDGGLEIKVQRKDEYKEEDKKKGFYRFERRYSGFYRYFPLPDDADAEKISATYKNGILELKIPKKEGKSEKKKRIEVK